MNMQSSLATLLTLGLLLAMSQAAQGRPAEKGPPATGSQQAEQRDGASRNYEYERPLIGADISWAPSQQDRGTTFSDQGTEKDVLPILADHKFNWIRLRLFVDPTAEDGYSRQGYCGLEQTLAMAKRVEAAGMQLLLDFHYSDTWADPGKRFTPASWKGLRDEELAEKIYEYTNGVIKRFAAEGVTPEMVQIGKEVNEIVRDLPDGLGWGAFIWEATSPRWGGLFDRDGATNDKIDIYPAYCETVESVQPQSKETEEQKESTTASKGGDIKVVRDIAYREGDSKAWRLDLAMPTAEAEEPRPALVIVHGGGWGAGSKGVDVYQKMMTDYAKKGYVTINVEYRLTGEAPFPACIEDVKCAVRWLRAHAEEYGVDPDRIGAYGHSAGAHLALMLAMVPKSAGLEGDGGWGDYSSRVNVAAAGSPPTELGRDVPMAKTEWWPIGYISADHPPLFLIQGGRDRVVRPELTEDFVEKMKAAGADIEYLKIEGDGHGVAYAESLDVTDPALEEFFAKHLDPPAPSEQTSPSSAAKTNSPWVIVEGGGTGPHPAVVTEDRTLPGMTIYRPRDLSAFGADRKLPVLLWGNGACANTTQEHKNFLNEIASHGYVVLAIGLLDQIEDRDESSRRMTRSSQLLTALDWILAENESTESVYFGKVGASKIAAMGMSCGGLQAIEISADPRITTTVVCNSGVLPDPSPMAAMPALDKEYLKNYHGPVLYIMGGPSDIAYNNAMDDFSRVDQVPIAMANLDVGHGGTYARPHGGEFTGVALAWLDWQLKDKTEASTRFLGEDSKLNRDPDWTVETKNFNQ